MKQFTISNQLTAIGKRLAMVLTLLLTISIGQAWGAEYELVSFSDIKTNDVIIIVGTKSGTAYAMKNTGTPPTPIKVTISNSKITSTATDITFTATNNGDNTITFVSTTSGTLYCTNDNNGVKIGSKTGNDTKFSFDSSVNRLKNIGKTRWLGIYNTQDWRCYTSASAANISGTTTTFYRKVTAASSHTITATSNNNSYGTVSVSGTTITATPNAGYRVKSGAAGYTVTSGTAVVTNNGDNTFTVTPSSNCTITINFEAIPKYTVTWNVNSEVYETTQVTEGSKPTFPATPSSCDATSNTFYGWATATWDGKINDVSAKTIYTSANDMPEVNGDVTYYAVFAKEETSGSGTAGWNEVTSTSDLEAGATYAISNAATGGNYLSTYAGANNFPNSTTTICKLVLGGSSNAWTFKINDASNYNNYYLTATNTTGSNYLKATNTIDNYCKFSISFGNAKNAVITCTGKNSRNILRYNSSNNPPIFACYSSGQSDVYLQKYSTGSTTTYSDYITTCAAGDPCASLQAPNVTATATANSITLSWAAVDGATSYNIYNYTTEELDETTNLTYTFNGLDPETEYEWGVESAKGECFKKTRGTTTTQEACTDAVTISKGTETNGTFTLSTTGQQSTCDGPVTVTLSNIQPATGYQFSEITQTGINTGVAINNTEKTVTYAKNTTGTSTINVTFIEIPKYTVTLNPNYPNGKTGTFTYDAGELVDGNLVFTYDYNTASKTLADLYTSLTLDGYEFGGWYNAKGANPGEVSGSKCTTTGTITGNKTYYAKWSKLYSITLSENGTTKELTPQTSTSYTLPTELSAGSCQDDTKELVGWSTVAIPNPGDKPTSNFYELGATVTLTADQTTFYAVFATAEGGGTENVEATLSFADKAQRTSYSTSQQVWEQNGIILTNEKGSSTTNVADYANPARFYKNSNITITAPGNITKIVFNCSEDDYTYTIGDNSEKSGTIVTTTLDGSKSSFTAQLSSGQVRMNSLTVTYTTGNGTSYSDYTTSCVALPDPVLSFATEPANPIVFTDAVCGGNSSKQSVTVVGENLRDVVNVSVTGPYKIARTASTALKDFTTSLTLDKTAAGAIHSNYQTVYIISTPPAQSTEATAGILTFTTTKGNTLTVNLSTPTVTCTQYTLTLNDRDTKTTAEYYAGASVPKPEDPTGVCTDPIHYVFDGWAEATVTEGSTTYTKVSFPYTMPAKATTLYAVYRYLEGGGNGDYNLVTSALDDWSGDYLIAYSNTIFADGQVGGKDALGAIGAEGIKVDLSQYISNNTIPATEGDKYNVTLEAVTGGYVLKTKDDKYNYHTNNTGNGISASTKHTADDYPITVKFVSEEEINLCLGGSAIGSVFRYNAQGFFRFYKNGGQQPVYLYKKADGTTYYTTSPVCGPHLAITEGKDIYVTGGNAGGTRDLVIAQTKVSYKATRLEKDKTTGNLPSIKALPSNIVFDNTKTKAVAVTFDEDFVRTLQSDGTYTITGNITIAYQPAAANVTDDIQVTLNANYNPSADVSQASFTVHARSLPSEFVIVAKSGDKWYALNGDMNTNAANPANGQVTFDEDANPTKATYAPCNTIYTFDGVPNTGDRTYVRFQGTDGAWLWSSSGTNVGIQNNVLKTTPEGSNKAYNWKLYTEDNITYRFGNANSSRQLTLSGEKFGMYASGVQDIRILPYVDKCLYNYAPTNLKVSVLKGTYVTLTWDAVAGATKYQYSTNGTTWTDAGTEPTVTINGLTGATEYTYYIRAYHEDAGVSQECIDYAEITFTTANCDDVPTNITYTADLNSITVSWTAAAPTATITYNTKEDGTGGGGTINNATSPYKISGGLDKNTTYYIQILADGTCASPIIPVKTEDVEVDIVEWMTDGIIVDINTDETIGVTLENEVSYGSGIGTEATELFFSKYYEATTNVKLVAIYNGTKNIIDLTDYEIHYGKTPEKGWETNYITLKDFGEIKGQIQPGEELILYTMSDSDNSDKQIMNCVNAQYPNGKWVRVTQANNTGKGSLSFAGDKTIVLKKAGTIIDIIGAINSNGLPNNAAVTRPSWGDANGWTCATGLSIADDTEIGISTNRCLLIRNNTVTSGENAVTNNIDNFNTLCSEWKGAQVPDSDEDNGVAASCENFAYVGTFDYSDYYTKYETMGDEQEFDEQARNDDGTVTIPITELYKHACSNIRVKLTNSNGDVLTDREYKVPIMITTTQGTDGQAFLDLQENLATKEVDDEGNVIDTHPLSLEDVREICKTCDVVVRDNATLTKVTDGTTNDHPQVHDVIVYEGASIVIPDGTNYNYTINSLALRRKGDEVASAQVQGTGKFVLPADAPVTLSMRIDANNWHWFTLPYDCDIAKVTWSDGTPAKYNTDWFLMYYDGESRAASTNPYDNHWKVYGGTTIEAGKGYIIGITGNLAHPNYTFELRFPMEQEVLTDEQKDKTVALNAWGVKSDNTPNNLGWNLVGNPYLNYYKTADGYSLAGLPLIEYTGIDPVTGDRLYDDNGHIPFLVTPEDGGWYAYKQDLASDVDMQPFTAYFVQVGDPDTHENGQALDASFEASNRGKKSILRRAPSEVDEQEEPAIVAVSLTNAKGESDKTTLLIADRFTNEYEMNADFFKWFGDYYKYYTKPVLYTIGADQGKRAFNALNEELAAQPVALGLYAAQAGNYTFSLNQRAELYAVAEVWLHDANNNTYTNLMQEDYTTSIAKTDGAGRFLLSVKMMQKLPTDIENTKQGNVWATTQNDQIIVAGLVEDMQLWIYDATGKLLHADRTTNYQHSYSVSQTGTYFIRVQNTTNTQTIKVVVE